MYALIDERGFDLAVYRSRRHPDQRRPLRPAGPPSFRRNSMPMLLALLSLLAFYICTVSAQAVSRTSSSASMSSASSLATQSAISVSGLPFDLILPPINSSFPSIQLDLPTTSPLYVTVNIVSLGTNTSILPTVLLSTTGSFAIGSRPQTDVVTGGSGGVANRRARGGGIWSLGWNQGFANWTWTGDEVGPQLLIGFGVGSDGQANGSVIEGNGDTVLEVGISSSCQLLPVVVV